MDDGVWFDAGRNLSKQLSRYLYEVVAIMESSWLLSSSLSLLKARIQISDYTIPPIPMCLLNAQLFGCLARVTVDSGKDEMVCIAAWQAELPRAYMTPSSVADSSKRKSEKMHGAMTDPFDGNSESAEDTSGQVDSPSWAVRLGRRGSTDSNTTQAVEDLSR
ncbi:hypothetical protein Tco_1298234, partial [Tanacetum coccineum]